MSKDIHKWSDGRYTLMFDEHTFFVFDNVKEERMTALNVTNKLNEQQARIELLEDNCLADNWTRSNLEGIIKEQQATINELKAQLREKEEDEKLYANEILELRETNKEHIKFKSLGGDY